MCIGTCITSTVMSFPKIHVNIQTPYDPISQHTYSIELVINGIDCVTYCHSVDKACTLIYKLNLESSVYSRKIRPGDKYELILGFRRIHTQERSRFPSRLNYQDILRLFRQAEISR